MKIRKAVITAAGPEQRELPLQRLVDRDGAAKSALRLLLDEAAAAGIGEVALVVHPDDRQRYLAAAGDAPAPGSAAPRVTCLSQPAPRGYADALLQARAFVGDEPFLHLVGDHLFLPRGATRPAAELVAVAEREGAAVSAVQATREAHLREYGAVGGPRVPGKERLFAIDAVVEKPTPTEAEQKLFVPGLRAGHYLCFFGMHVLPAALFEPLAVALHAAADPRKVSLTEALATLPGRARWLALEVEATRFNLGEKYGLLIAQLALGLSGDDRDDVLAQVTELLLAREKGRASR
ncbi:MAG: UTP--glucose-1-phosphate uridylyltransferase [Planctomycetes bacterium]|nr:UTP--glucose-1-phosphate uridylyltransferase [Planctomycetota bacterium]